MHLFLFENLYKLSHLSKRTFSNKLIKPLQFSGFEYFPRQENFKDPPYNPSKLFLLTRVKPLKGTNFEEKKCLRSLNIDGHVRYQGHVNIVKNIPEINALIWKVKHLVEIKPITYTGELPTDSNFSGTYLRSTGEFIISPKLHTSSEVLDKTDKYVNGVNRISRKYIKKYLLDKWAKHNDVI